MRINRNQTTSVERRVVELSDTHLLQLLDRVLISGGPFEEVTDKQTHTLAFVHVECALETRQHVLGMFLCQLDLIFHSKLLDGSVDAFQASNVIAHLGQDGHVESLAAKREEDTLGVLGNRVELRVIGGECGCGTKPEFEVLLDAGVEMVQVETDSSLFPAFCPDGHVITIRHGETKCLSSYRGDESTNYGNLHVKSIVMRGTKSAAVLAHHAT